MAVQVKRLSTPVTFPSHQAEASYPHIGHDGGANINMKAIQKLFVSHWSFGCERVQMS